MAFELEVTRQKYGLTEKQAKLAFAYVAGGSLMEAATKANLSYGEAQRLFHEHAEWRQAVTELIDIMLVDDMVKARVVARDMMENAESDKVRLDAVKMLWDRAAGEPLKRVQETRTVSLDDLAKGILKLAHELGMKTALPLEVKATVVEENGRDNPKLQGPGTASDVGAVRESARDEPDVVVQSGESPSSNSETA